MIFWNHPLLKKGYTYTLHMTTIGWIRKVLLQQHTRCMIWSTKAMRHMCLKQQLIWDIIYDITIKSQDLNPLRHQILWRPMSFQPLINHRSRVMESYKMSPMIIVSIGSSQMEIETTFNLHKLGPHLSAPEGGIILWVQPCNSMSVNKTSLAGHITCLHHPKIMMEQDIRQNSNYKTGCTIW